MINWVAETETNNDHFLIQVSADGVHFKTVQTVKSQAADGNSHDALDYIAVPIPSTTLSIGEGFLLTGIVIGYRRRYETAVIAVLFSLLLFAYNKKNLFRSIEEGNLFVRIVQVDKDGNKIVSKVVKVME